MYLFSFPATSPVDGHLYNVRLYLSMAERDGLVNAGIIPPDTSLIEALYEESGEPIKPSSLGILAPTHDQTYIQ